MSVTVRLTGSGLRTRTIRCDGCGTTAAETAEVFMPVLCDFVAEHRPCQVGDDRHDQHRLQERSKTPRPR